MPLTEITSASIKLDLTSFSTVINPLPAASPNLFDAQVYDRGNLQFSNQGSNGNMNISLGESGFTGLWFNTTGDYRWTIGLSPKVPIDLTIRASSGSSNVDLSGLQLTRLTYTGSSGSNDLKLPSNTKAYNMTYHGSSGSTDITLPADANLTMSLDGSSGSISVQIQGNAAVRVEVNGNGSGSVSVNDRLKRLSGSSNRDEGVWESSGYAQADQKILIIVAHVSSGSISIN